MTSNSKGVFVSRQREYLIYDSFPAGVREVLRRAPYDYKVSGSIAKLVRANPGAARRHLISMMCADVVREVVKLYGPDHPQAADPFPRRRRP
jgi:putative heme iron utilization protein